MRVQYKTIVESEQDAFDRELNLHAKDDYHLVEFHVIEATGEDGGGVATVLVGVMVREASEPVGFPA